MKNSRALKRESVTIWEDVKNAGGWQVAPNALFKRRAELGLELEEVMLALHVLQYQFDKDALPYVKIRTLASMMGVHESSVKRWKNGLIAKGALKLKPRFKDHSQQANLWDFSPLVQLVRALPPVKNGKGGGFTAEPRGGSLLNPGGVTVEPPLQEDSIEEDEVMKKTNADAAARHLAFASPPGKEVAHRVPPFEVNQNSSAPDAARQDSSAASRIEQAQSVAADTAAKTDEARKSKDRKRAQKQFDEKRKGEQLKQNLSGKPIVEAVRKKLKALEATWLGELREANRGLSIPGWEPKSFKMVRDLLDLYEPSVIESAIKYVIRCWPQLRMRFWKGKGGVVPGVGFLRKFHDTIFPEAQKWFELEKSLIEWRKFSKENPTVVNPPADLWERYKKAKVELAAMGFEA